MRGQALAGKVAIVTGGAGSIGQATAEGCVDPWRQKADVWFGRMRAATQTRACLSIAKLCAVVCAVQIASSPQYGDGAAGEIHLRQKPAAKDISMRIGKHGHSNGPQRQF